MMKRNCFLALLTACGMLMTGIPTAIPVSADETYGNLTYHVYDEYVKITGCSALAMAVEIPEEIDGLPVKSIDDYAFYDCTVLKQVIIPHTITSIGKYAFENCSSLSSIELPEGLTKIGVNAFTGSGLISVTIPDSVVNLYSAFTDCDMLTTAKLGSGVTELKNTFYGCDSLETITVPENVTYLDSTFIDCINLKTVTFEANSQLETIYKAFIGCSSLDNISLPQGLLTISAGFTSCTNLKNVKLPEGLLTMEGGFAGCTSLRTIAIPDSVTYLFGTFMDCTSLETVTFGKNSMLESMEYTFKGCINLKEITIPKNLTNYAADPYYGPFSECTGLEKITFLNAYTDIPNLETSIPENTVIYCYENSTAHAYALVQNRNFEIMEESTHSIGDLNADGTVDASDAAAILIAAAAVGSGADSGLDAEQKSLADLNDDRIFDANDAALILQFAAYAGAGGELTIEEFLNDKK